MAYTEKEFSWELGVAGGSQIKGKEYSSVLLVNVASEESWQEPGFEGSEHPLLPLRTWRIQSWQCSAAFKIETILLWSAGNLGKKQEPHRKTDPMSNWLS